MTEPKPTSATSPKPNTATKGVWVASDLAYLHLLAARIVHSEKTMKFPDFIIEPKIAFYALGKYRLTFEVPAESGHLTAMEIVGAEKRNGKGKIEATEYWEEFWSRTPATKIEETWCSTYPLCAPQDETQEVSGE